ncbi:MAG: hypothetical protein ACLRNW_29010 [Neglectibacter sp.]
MAQFRELTDLSPSTCSASTSRHPNPGADAKASLVLDDQPAGVRCKSGKTALKGKPGMDLRITKSRNRSGWRKIWTTPSGAGRRGAYPRCREKGTDQYRKTRSQMMKLAAEPDGDAQTQALEAVATYTQTFNKMRFIETEERDEIYMALRVSWIPCREIRSRKMP